MVCQAATYVLTLRAQPETNWSWVRRVLHACPLLVDYQHPLCVDSTNKITFRLLLANETSEAQIEAFLKGIESVVSIQRTENWTPYVVTGNYVQGEFMLRGY